MQSASSCRSGEWKSDTRFAESSRTADASAKADVIRAVQSGSRRIRSAPNSFVATRNSFVAKALRPRG
eukprot:6862408-Pyramimonas_sp.AAC.2